MFKLLALLIKLIALISGQSAPDPVVEQGPPPVVEVVVDTTLKPSVEVVEQTVIYSADEYQQCASWEGFTFCGKPSEKSHDNKLTPFGWCWTDNKAMYEAGQPEDSACVVALEPTKGRSITAPLWWLEDPWVRQDGGY